MLTTGRTGQQQVQKYRCRVTDQAIIDRGLGEDGLRTHANSCNLPTMDLGQATIGLRRATTGLRRATMVCTQATTDVGHATTRLGQATTGHGRATKNHRQATTGCLQAHTSTPLCTCMHSEFLKAGRLVSNIRPYFPCFCFQTCLAKQPPLHATMFAYNHLSTQPHLQATTCESN